ncbi:tetratricopeptide repeat protein [Gimesia alba]|nr:tetratricopeptide repeat protein [Gimesia alba]
MKFLFIIFGAGYTFWFLFLLIGEFVSSFKKRPSQRNDSEMTPEDSVTYFSKQIQKNPRDTAAYLARSTAFYHLEQFDLAIADCDTVTQLEPQNHFAYFNRGAVYALHKEFEKAIVELTHCLELKPDLADALFNRAYSYSSIGNIDSALSDFNRLVELGPHNPQHYHTRGHFLLQLQKYPEAAQDYTLAIQYAPQEWEYYFNRGCAYSKQGKLKAARSDFERALELNPFDETIRLNPEDMESYQQRGNLYFCAEQYQNALDDFIQIPEPSTELQVLIGYCYLRSDDVEKAKSIFREALEQNVYGEAINLNSADSTLFLDRAYLLLNLDEFERAIEDLTHAMNLGEQSAELLAARGTAYYELHHFQKAKLDFEAAIQQAPEFHPGYNGLAWMMATCPDPEFRDARQSLGLARKNLELHPEPEWSDLGTLAAALAATGDFEEAIRMGKESLSLAPKHEQAECETRLECYERHEVYIDTTE